MKKYQPISAGSGLGADGIGCAGADVGVQCGDGPGALRRGAGSAEGGTARKGVKFRPGFAVRAGIKQNQGEGLRD